MDKNKKAEKNHIYNGTSTNWSFNDIISTFDADALRQLEENLKRRTKEMFEKQIRDVIRESIVNAVKESHCKNEPGMAFRFYQAGDFRHAMIGPNLENFEIDFTLQLTLMSPPEIRPILIRDTKPITR